MGGVLGLTQMGTIKAELAHESAQADLVAAVLAGDASVPTSTADTTEVVLAPGASAEVKLVMREGARATYS